MGSIFLFRRKRAKHPSGAWSRASVRRQLRSAVIVYYRLFNLVQLVDVVMDLGHQFVKSPLIVLGHRPLFVFS